MPPSPAVASAPSRSTGVASSNASTRTRTQQSMPAASLSDNILSGSRNAPPSPHLADSEKESGRIAVGQLVLALALSILGLAQFSKGYFPVKSLLPGYAGLPEDEIRAPEPFARLVFMLVDALRTDFVFGPNSSMPYVNSLLADSSALPFTALAQSPTVTLPRLKALTTGSNPTFLDAMLNIAESNAPALHNVDSWVRQLAVQKRKKTVFVGDDTWLRLFPAEWFSWSEGVSSFFVSVRLSHSLIYAATRALNMSDQDTTTVDSNVTRHLDSLLAEGPSSADSGPPSDWDVLILHYLGMDHVGHLGGPQSPLMAPKQREMDAVVQKVFERLRERDTADGRRSLFVLLGDHGMTEMGNHGGSSEGEIASALLLASPSEMVHTTPIHPVASAESQYHFHEVVHQVDLVPTLAVLFGFGIPINSMGRLIESSIAHFFPDASYGRFPSVPMATSYDPSSETPPPSDFLASSLARNAAQLKATLDASVSGAAALLACEASANGISPGALCDLTTPSELSEFTKLAQGRLLTTFGDYNLSRMLLGLVLLLLGAAVMCLSATQILRREDRFSFAIISSWIVVYMASFFATSFVEEEHELWYFGGTTALLLLAFRHTDLSKRIRLVLAAASVRVMRAWPHNGQKVFTNNGLAARISTSPSLLLLGLVAITSLHAVLVFISLIRASHPKYRRGASPGRLFLRANAFALLITLALMHSLLVFSLHVAKDDSLRFKGIEVLLALLAELGLGGPVEIARSGYLVGAIAWAAISLVRLKDPEVAQQLNLSRLSTLVLLLLSLTRPANSLLFFALWIQFDTLFLVPDTSPVARSLVLVTFQHVAFFAFGGSNSLATVDLSQAYNGVASYSLLVTTLLTFISNFAGPIFFSLVGPTVFPRSVLRTHLLLVSTFHSLALFGLAASATHFRRHLFTWTVFSPAVLYKTIWSTFVGVGADLVLGPMLM